MNRPPRPPTEPLFPWGLVAWGLLQGAIAFLPVAGIFLLGASQGMPETELRALTFFSLVISIVSLIFVNRSFSASFIAAFSRPNTALRYVLLAVAVTLGLTLLWPWASALFRFGPLHWDDLLITLGAGAVTLASLEFMKFGLRRSFRPHAPG